MSKSQTSSEPSRFLRRTLLVDGILCGVSGLGLLVLPGPVASFLGLSSSLLVAAVGVSLLVFAAGVLRNASRPTPRRQHVVLTFALNVAWVVGTVVVVLAGGLSRPGNWALMLVADVVVIMAILETIGLRKMTGGGALPGAPVTTHN